MDGMSMFKNFMNTGFFENDFFKDDFFSNNDFFGKNDFFNSDFNSFGNGFSSKSVQT